MSNSMTAWGIGPTFFGISLVYFALAAILHLTDPVRFAIAPTPHLLFPVIGVSLIGLGITLWIRAVRVIDRAFEENRLLTQGAYALVRNPMYAAFIVFIFPGVALWFQSWLLLTVPVVAYGVCRALLYREEQYLAGKFGQAYLNYKSKVNAIVPLRRFGK